MDVRAVVLVEPERVFPARRLLLVRGEYLHRRLLKRGYALLDSDLLSGDDRDRLRSLDGTLRDLAMGDGAPRGFDPERFIAPGVPRIRPVMVLLSEHAARPGSPDDADAQARREGAEHVAVAVELLHLAVAVHDAALGRQGGRRRRAARRLLGGAVGWLGGNHLTLRALELARHTPAPEVVGDMVDALREVAEGHALSQSVQNRMATVDECLSIADGHTGAVFSFACRAGGRIAGADRAIVGGLGRYGRHAGIAWHLAEDLWSLDLRGEEGDESLRALIDFAAAGRPLVPVSMAAERDPDVGRMWLELSRGGDQALGREVAETVRALGAISDSRQRLALESWSARQALAALPPSPERDALDRIARSMVA